MEKILGARPSAIIWTGSEESRCSCCGGVIGAESDYLQLTGENLHIYCLIDYLQDMNVLKVVMRLRRES